MRRVGQKGRVSRKIVLLIAFAACVAHGGTYTIHSTYDEETEQWVGNFDELTNAVKSCSDWSTIKLEKGIYDISPLTNAPMGTSTYQGTSLLHLKVGTTFIGATGNRDDVVIKGCGKYRLLQHANGCVIKHMTFTGGHSEGGSYPIGGAIYPTGSAIEIRNCAFLFNSSSSHGGAVGGNHNSRSGDNYYSCYFYGNSTGGAGYGGAGAGGNYYDCTIVSNKCVYEWGLGGGIYGASLVRGCTVVSNFSAQQGGGLAYCKAVTNCYIAFNAASGPHAARGAGLADCGTITNCTVEYNVASSWGHGMIDTSAYGSVFRFNGPSHYARDTKNSTFEKCEFVGSSIGGATLIDHCHIHHVSNSFDVIDNVTFGPQRRGVTYAFENTRHIRNSLIDHCWITNAANHAAFYTGGNNPLYVENCTIADNRFYYILRGYTNTPATAAFVNTALVRNYRGNTPIDLSGYEARAVYITNSYLCVKSLTQRPEIEHVEAHVMGAGWDPKFVGKGEFPYELRRASALRTSGQVLDWMAEATDLAGNPRLRDGKVDIGCYQCWLDPVGTMFSIR